MQDAITRLVDPNLQIRVGLHTGEVVVQDSVENSIYQTYDAAGHERASRKSHGADGGCGLYSITGDTYALAKQFVEVVALGATSSGIAAPVEYIQSNGAEERSCE